MTPKPLKIAEIVLLIVVVVGGGWWLAKQPAHEARPSPIVTEWTTYRSEKYGFEIKLLPGWEVVVAPNYYGGGVLRSSETPFAITYHPERFTDISTVQAAIFIMDNSTGKTSVEFTREFKSSDPLFSEYQQIKASFRLIR